MTPHDEICELWRNLLRYHRRALLVLAYVDPDLDSCEWHDLPADTHMRLVRAMGGLGELAVDCAVVLERVRASLDRNARSPREELQDRIDELAFAPMPGSGVSSEDAAAYAREAQRVRRELADIRSRKRSQL